MFAMIKSKISHMWIFFVLVTGTCKRKNNQDEGKHSNNNDVIDGDHKVYGLVSLVNWNHTSYKTETEANHALKSMKNMGLGSSIKLMSASSKEGLVALIDNKKKQKSSQQEVDNNKHTQECAPAQITPVKKKMKTLKVQKISQTPDIMSKLSACNTASANPYLDHV